AHREPAYDGGTKPHQCQDAEYQRSHLEHVKPERMAVPEEDPARNEERDEVAGEHHQNPIVKRHQPPKMLLVFKELRRESRVSEFPREVTLYSHQKKSKERYVRQSAEQELIEIVPRVIHRFFLSAAPV